jgi:hypothetical protein
MKEMLQLLFHLHQLKKILNLKLQKKAHQKHNLLRKKMIKSQILKLLQLWNQKMTKNQVVKLLLLKQLYLLTHTQFQNLS